jgi:Glycosyl transferase family 2
VSAAPPPGATWVILPTSDEAENVEAMIEAVLARLDGAGIEGRVPVVDDGSPDGTAGLAEAVAATAGAHRALGSATSRAAASRAGDRCAGSSAAWAAGTPSACWGWRCAT